MPLFDIENEYFNKANQKNRYGKKDLFGGVVDPLFSNKTSLFELRKFSFDFGLYEKVSNYFYTRRERKVDKILEDITDKANVLPRGYGSLPANKNRSLNGYYNFKYANVPGNEDYINKRLYYNELQIIDELVHEVKPQLLKLCGNDPRLIEKVEKQIADLYRRSVIYNKLRVGEPVDKQELFDLEDRLGNQRAAIALAGNKGLNAKQENMLHDLLVRAEKFLGENRTVKEKAEMKKILEELNVYLRDNEADLVLGLKNAAPENRTPLVERFLFFTKGNDQKQSEPVKVNSRKTAKGAKEISAHMTEKVRE